MQSEDIPYKDYDHIAKMARGFAFTIDRDGRWYCHDPNMGEGPIRREALAKLFAGAGIGFMAGKGLSVDDDGNYWLKSPHDAYAVEVEDVPFIISDFDIEGDTLVLKTNFGERVSLDKERSFVFPADAAFAVPYVNVRKGLLARLGRSVLYNLVPLAIERDGQLYLESDGIRHRLGAAA